MISTLTRQVDPYSFISVVSGHAPHHQMMLLPWLLEPPKVHFCSLLSIDTTETLSLSKMLRVDGPMRTWNGLTLPKLLKISNFSFKWSRNNMEQKGKSFWLVEVIQELLSLGSRSLILIVSQPSGPPLVSSMLSKTSPCSTTISTMQLHRAPAALKWLQRSPLILTKLGKMEPLTIRSYFSIGSLSLTPTSLTVTSCGISQTFSPSVSNTVVEPSSAKCSPPKTSRLTPIESSILMASKKVWL